RPCEDLPRTRRAGPAFSTQPAEQAQGVPVRLGPPLVHLAPDDELPPDEVFDRRVVEGAVRSGQEVPREGPLEDLQVPGREPDPELVLDALLLATLLRHGGGNGTVGYNGTEGPGRPRTVPKGRP